MKPWVYGQLYTGIYCSLQVVIWAKFKVLLLYCSNVCFSLKKNYKEMFLTNFSIFPWLWLTAHWNPNFGLLKSTPMYNIHTQLGVSFWNSSARYRNEQPVTVAAKDKKFDSCFLICLCGGGSGSSDSSHSPHCVIIPQILEWISFKRLLLS